MYTSLFLSSIFEKSIVHTSARDIFTRRYEPIEIFFIIDTTFESKMFSFLFPLSPLSLLPTNRPFHRRCVTPEIGSRRPDWPSPTARRLASADPPSEQRAQERPGQSTHNAALAQSAAVPQRRAQNRLLLYYKGSRWLPVECRYGSCGHTLREKRLRSNPGVT